ncbi:hypothetical protein BV20DRAFT_1056940 [Pilatotrama ljubarskyi]|nr:hypothetical protein BV20DRAFT_1056940 [Pilatotrama ljubarskyi]
MRLLDTFTGRFQRINDPMEVRYAILSHTWSEEQSYQDILKLQESTIWRRGTWLLHKSAAELKKRSKSTTPTPASRAVRDNRPVPESLESVPGGKRRYVSSFFTAPALSAKIKGACKVAREHGYRFIWIDTCCIDKTSSAELSEAINSMFLWYTLADVCFVYMADVPHSLNGPVTGKYTHFWGSKWHTRGWTLQELIAPGYMLFLDSEWSVIGSKMELASTLAEITRVDEAVLVHAVPVSRVSVANRMQWASERRTTRVEDEASCLMGLFGVHMPTIYGEGRKAFIRLQQEIIKTIPDQSIFVWKPSPLGYDRGTEFLLADSPSAYSHLQLRSPVSVIGHKDFRALFDSPEFPNPIPSALPLIDCTFTANGARIRLPCIDLSASPHRFRRRILDRMNGAANA